MRRFSYSFLFSSQADVMLVVVHGWDKDTLSLSPSRRLYWTASRQASPTAYERGTTHRATSSMAHATRCHFVLRSFSASCRKSFASRRENSVGACAPAPLTSRVGASSSSPVPVDTTRRRPTAAARRLAQRRQLGRSDSEVL
mmetsp:Transcript_7612/g.24030  ORF Transcript_7612/g.24030 Transcript_7612/m.24030 type:complete len:142 (+) Transcript_7612:1702-2127(+)